MPKQILIKKLSGEREVFSWDKFRRSLENAGVPAGLINDVVRQMEGKIKRGMSTREIYRLTFNLLKKQKNSLAARYSLKKAIFEMGPAGYPFEKFVAKILEKHGYSVEINQIVQGRCVRHEVDVIAKNDNRVFFIECKFHSKRGIRSDVKVALYIKARFDDIQKNSNQEAWLITNTKFSGDAIQYANCLNMKITGWSYPNNESLKKMVENSNLHPLTCLTTLNSYQKRTLLARGIVLCSDILKSPQVFKQINVNKAVQEKVMSEIKEVLG